LHSSVPLVTLRMFIVFSSFVETGSSLGEGLFLANGVFLLSEARVAESRILVREALSNQCANLSTV